MAETPETNKPDLKNGFPIRDLGDGSMISGQVDGEELVLVRRGDEFFAIGAHCTHYGGPLAEGLIVGGHCALSLAPCLFQFTEWRSAAGTGS
jgi:nitrite reductase/ring-hydroxylating ferredoxin subunit